MPRSSLPARAELYAARKAAQADPELDADVVADTDPSEADASVEQNVPQAVLGGEE